MPIYLPGGRRRSTPAERRQFAHQNERKPCAAPGCIKRRHWTGKWCSTHAWRVRHHGHPEGLLLDNALVLTYRKKMAAFLDTYADAPQVDAAVQFMGRLLSGRLSTRKSYAQRELRRLRDDGLDAMEALEIVGGVYLLSLYRPETLPDDRRLNFALATWLFKARPYQARQRLSSATGSMYTQYVQPLSGAKDEVGGLIRQHLSVFFRHVFTRIEADYRTEVRARMALKEPITASPSPTPQPAMPAPPPTEAKEPSSSW